MVYITGDCHGDFRKLGAVRFPEQHAMTKDDFVIICGDFGGVWSCDETPEEQYWLNWLETKSFTTLFVDGNHENFDRLYGGKFTEVDFHGGRAHQIRENVYHLMRGHVFELCGKKFFAFGGASSHDIDDGILDPDEFPTKASFRRTYEQMLKLGKMFRVKGESWWPQELPNEAEMQFGRETLAANDYKVDFVVTHCLPTSVQAYMSDGNYKPDILTDYFQSLINSGLQFEGFYSGHYHMNQTFLNKYHVLYEKIERIV